MKKALILSLLAILVFVVGADAKTRAKKMYLKMTNIKQSKPHTLMRKVMDIPTIAG